MLKYIINKSYQLIEMNYTVQSRFILKKTSVAYAGSIFLLGLSND